VARFAPTTLDLGLAALVAIGLPFAAAWLFDWTGGALASLVLYYGVCCLAVVRWRRGRLDYHWPARWPWLIFLPSLLLPAVLAFINLEALPREGSGRTAVILTLLIWGGINAACEQLSWFYVFDSWRLRWREGVARWVGLGVGLLLTLGLIGLIHALFWAKFLPLAEQTGLTRFSLPLNMVLTGAYYWLYRRSGSMWPVFVLHFLVDAQLVWIAQYSIWPDL
jgi:hypothetical protein